MPDGYPLPVRPFRAGPLSQVTPLFPFVPEIPPNTNARQTHRVAAFLTRSPDAIRIPPGFLMSFHRFLILLPLAWVPATGQRLAHPVPGTFTLPATWPPCPVIAPVVKAEPALKPDPGFGETRIVADINKPRLNGEALATLHRRYSGRRVIVSAAAAIAEFSFVQEASPQHPLTYARAVELLKMSATIENFEFVPHLDNPTIDRLILAKHDPPRGCSGLAVYSENQPLPEGDGVISYVMTLQHIKPEDAMSVFTESIGKFGPNGSMAAVPDTSVVVITENTSIIRKIIDLKKEIDQP